MVRGGNAFRRQHYRVPAYSCEPHFDQIISASAPLPAKTKRRARAGAQIQRLDPSILDVSQQWLRNRFGPRPQIWTKRRIACGKRWNRIAINLVAGAVWCG